MAIEAVWELLINVDEYEHLSSGGEAPITAETLPPVPEGYIDGQTGGYWQDPVSKEWHFITGAGHYNDKGVYIFDNLFKK